MESVIFAVFVVVVVCFIPDVPTDATFGLELGKIRFELGFFLDIHQFEFFFSVSNFHYFGKCDSSALMREISISFNCSVKFTDANCKPTVQ